MQTRKYLVMYLWRVTDSWSFHFKEGNNNLSMISSSWHNMCHNLLEHPTYATAQSYINLLFQYYSKVYFSSRLKHRFDEFCDTCISVLTGLLWYLPIWIIFSITAITILKNNILFLRQFECCNLQSTKLGWGSVHVCESHIHIIRTPITRWHAYWFSYNSLCVWVSHTYYKRL